MGNIPKTPNAWLSFSESIILLLILAAPIRAERGLWTFDKDPGLQTHYLGEDPAFRWQIKDGVLNVRVSREEQTQRLVVPLQGKYDHDQHFWIRTRFRYSVGWRGRFHQGFFNSATKNFTGDLTGDHVVFRYVARPSWYPNLHSGGAWGRGEQTLELDTWYVMEAHHDPAEKTWTATLYTGDGKTKLQSIHGPMGSFDGTEPVVDVVGFGNFDLTTPEEGEHFNLRDFEASFDWFSWSVNDDLPADPVTIDLIVKQAARDTQISEAGKTGAFTLTLSHPPRDRVVVGFHDDDLRDQVVVSPSRVTFTPQDWKQPQKLTITAVDDPVPEANPHRSRIAFNLTSADRRYDGLVVKDLDVQIVENDFVAKSEMGRALWLLDEGPDDANYWSVVDQSGNQSHGKAMPKTAGRPKYVANTPFEYPGNYALEFSPGRSARVETSMGTALDIRGALTIETWVCLNSLGKKQYLIVKRDAAGAARGYSLEWSGDSDDACFKFTVGTTNGYQTVASRDFRPQAGKWYHLAGVHDPASEKNLLYIDGKLNNSAPSDEELVPNQRPLSIGGDLDGAHTADAILDEVRISGQALDADQLGHRRSMGPGRILHADNFEFYNETSDAFSSQLASKSPDSLNRWKTDGPGGTSVELTKQHHRSGNQAMLLSLVDMPAKASSPLYFWYDGRPEMFFDHGRLGFEGWVSFENLENVKLFFLNFKDGYPLSRESDQRTNVGAALIYDSRQKRWMYEVPHGGPYEPFSEPVTYEEGIGETWHYFKFVVDFDNRQPVSFQFDDRTWDLSKYPTWVLAGFEDDLPPFMTLNLRVFTYEKYDGRYTTRIAVDDIAVTNEDIQFLTSGKDRTD